MRPLTPLPPTFPLASSCLPRNMTRKQLVLFHFPWRDYQQWGSTIFTPFCCSVKLALQTRYHMNPLSLTFPLTSSCFLLAWNVTRKAVSSPFPFLFQCILSSFQVRCSVISPLACSLQSPPLFLPPGMTGKCKVTPHSLFSPTLSFSLTLLRFPARCTARQVSGRTESFKRQG